MYEPVMMKQTKQKNHKNLCAVNQNSFHNLVIKCRGVMKIFIFKTWFLILTLYVIFVSFSFCCCYVIIIYCHIVCVWNNFLWWQMTSLVIIIFLMMMMMMIISCNSFMNLGSSLSTTKLWIIIDSNWIDNVNDDCVFHDWK